jgi:hypothetical protein
MYKYIVILFFLFASCQSDLEHDFSKEEIEQESKKFGQRSIIIEKNGIRLIEIVDFPVFEDVKLKLLSKNAKYLEGKNKLEFSLLGFNLGEKTVAENDLELPIEDGGQYILLNNLKNKEIKKFSSQIETELSQGENYFLAFLSRSYRISLKNPESSLLLKITTNNSEGTLVEENKEPYLYLNEPNGVFEINKTKKILLDFYIKNTTVSSNGNYISLIIDGTEFKLTKWAPFYIEGLGIGKHNISIALKNKNGLLLKGKLIQEINREFEITDSSLFE